MQVKDIMAHKVITIRPDDFSGKALEILKEHKIHHLVVTDEDDQIVGMLSDRDLRSVLNVLASSGDKNPADDSDLSLLRVYNVRIKKIMTPNPMLISADFSVAEAARIMLEKRIHSLPVEENGKLAGIITHNNILRAVAEEKLQ